MWARTSRIVLTGVLAVFVVLLWAGWAWLQNWMHIENESGQHILELTIVIAGETIRFEDIPAGGKSSRRFPINTDDHFVVEGRLADGTRIFGEFGYVTNGMFREHARFVIKPDGGIQFNQGYGEA